MPGHGDRGGGAGEDVVEDYGAVGDLHGVIAGAAAGVAGLGDALGEDVGRCGEICCRCDFGGFEDWESKISSRWLGSA